MRGVRELGDLSVSRASDQPPSEQRAFLLYYAGVLLREAKARRGQKNVRRMIEGAAKARRQALAIDLSPAQGSLL